MNSWSPDIHRIALAIDRANHDMGSFTNDDAIELSFAFRMSYHPDFEPLQTQYAESSNGNDLQQDLVVALSKLPNGSACWCVDDLLHYFNIDSGFYELAHAALALSFPIAEQVDQSFLIGNMQIAVMSSIVNNDEIWRNDATIGTKLSQHGLPKTQDGLAELLGAANSGG